MVQGTPWLIGLSLLAPGWINVGQPSAGGSGSVGAAGQFRLYVRVRHYADFIRTTVEVRSPSSRPGPRTAQRIPDAAADPLPHRPAMLPWRARPLLELTLPASALRRSEGL